MKLGFIGTGKIASSVILGVCRSKIKFRQIIVSPRNKRIANNLKKKLLRYDITKVYDLQNSSRTKFYKKFIIKSKINKIYFSRKNKNIKTKKMRRDVMPQQNHSKDYPRKNAEQMGNLC